MQPFTILFSVDYPGYGAFGPPPLCLVDYRSSAPYSLLEGLRKLGVIVRVVASTEVAEDLANEWKRSARRPTTLADFEDWHSKPIYCGADVPLSSSDALALVLP